MIQLVFWVTPACRWLIPEGGYPRAESQGADEQANHTHIVVETKLIDEYLCVNYGQFTKQTDMEHYVTYSICIT